MTMATTNLATMPLSLNDFSEILPSNQTNIVDYPSPSHNLTSFNLGSYSDLQNYFVLNNDDPVDAAAQPQQPLSFDHTSEFVIMTTCSACTFLNDSRSIMCVLCHNPLSPQELNISYLDDNYNVPFSQPYSLPSQPQIQQQLQHQIQQQQQSLQPHPQLQPNVQQQLPFPRLHSHPSQPRLQRQLEQQIQHLQIQRQLRPPTTQQFQPQLQPQFPIQSQTQEQLGQHLQMQQNVQLQMQQNFQLQFQQQQLQSQMQQSQVQQPLLPKRQQSQLRTNALLRINALQRIQLRQKLSQQRLQQQRSKQQRLQQLKRLQQTSHLQTQPQSQPQPQLLSNFSFPTSIPSTPTSFNASDPTNKCVLSKTKLKVLSEGDAEYNQIRDYFFIGLPHANIHSIIQLQMPTKLINAHAQYKHTSLLNHLSTTQEDNLDKFTYRMFHGTKISCNPKRLINGHNSYCMFNCGMCGIIQNGNQRKYSRFNGRMWFANNSAISLGYCNLSTSRTFFNCTPFASKSSLLAMFVVDVVSYNSSDIIIVDKDEATLPRYLILFEIGF
ncbi:15125_t:CDS:2 [Funneliformis mosseae]|uniref:15125_t:CDS:1 n=1 Tax=Funneliformis mosseae TaxID=27381 RepID=A0A9N9B8P5_FUNMO|nr:15125_t:CDS:2 [Funneliformis mosseae]